MICESLSQASPDETVSAIELYLDSLGLMGVCGALAFSTPDSALTLFERDLLNNTLDVYLSSVANRTNQVMKVLTVLSTIALPALVITSFYGMNVKGLPFIDAAYGAYYVIAAIAVSTVLMLVVMRKARWLYAEIATGFAGVPVRAPSSLRVANIRSMLVTSIGSSATPSAIETPPGRSPLNVEATVLPPEAVIRMTFAPPSVCRAAAGSVVALSM